LHFSCNRQHIVGNWNRYLVFFYGLLKGKNGHGVSTTGSMFNASISDNNSTTAKSVISGMAGGIIGYSH